MATPVLIPVSEYLNTTYRPDRDYVNGELKERILGESPHATLQGFLYSVFFSNRKTWAVRPFTEQRIQTSATNYRVADVCVVRIGHPPGGIIRTPPLICIEVLSPGQSLSDIRESIDDYLSMGVQNVWILDPAKRLAWYGTVDGFHPLSGEEFSVPETPIRIALADIYEELDEMAAGR